MQSVATKRADRFMGREENVSDLPLRESNGLSPEMERKVDALVSRYFEGLKDELGDDAALVQIIKSW